MGKLNSHELSNAKNFTKIFIVFQATSYDDDTVAPVLDESFHSRLASATECTMLLM